MARHSNIDYEACANCDGRDGEVEWEEKMWRKGGTLAGISGEGRGKMKDHFAEKFRWAEEKKFAMAEEKKIVG